MYISMVIDADVIDLKCTQLIESISFVAVGAGQHHHSEISEDIYTDASTRIFVDCNSNAKNELKTLNAPIVGEVGDIINGHRSAPSSGITIFHSMGNCTECMEFCLIIKQMQFLDKFLFCCKLSIGMAVEDVSVAQAILEKFNRSQSPTHTSLGT